MMGQFRSLQCGGPNADVGFRSEEGSHFRRIEGGPLPLPWGWAEGGVTGELRKGHPGRGPRAESEHDTILTAVSGLVAAEG